MKKRIINKIFLICINIMLIFSKSVLAIGNLKPDDGAVSYVETPMKVIIGIFQVVAIGVGAIMLVALTVKYMSAAPGDKAEIKKHAVVYIVGACMAFASSGIVGIIQQLASDVTKE